MKEVTDQLTDEGVKLFADAFDKLLGAVEKNTKRAQPKVSPQTYVLPADLDSAVKTTSTTGARMEKFAGSGSVMRLSGPARTKTSGSDGSTSSTNRSAPSAHLKKIAEDAKNAGFTDILLLGMGGSSLCPDVFALTYGKNAGFPQLHVLDSTDPAQVKAIENKINPAKTLFIVSSKSGTTLEPNIFKQYFFERAKKTVGADKAGSRFIAITDPGSKMQKVAETDRFRHIFAGVPSIGGRYSALSNFGMVPGRCNGSGYEPISWPHPGNGGGMRVQVSRSKQNPGVLLGAILGTAARAGRDKLTFIASPGIQQSRRMARTTDRRIHRQARQRHRSG